MDWRKSIDLIYKNAHETWLLEAKTKLNYEALGEVLTYGVLYRANHPEKPVKLGIVCAALDEDILDACKALQVAVFQVMADNVAVEVTVDGELRPHLVEAAPRLNRVHRE